MRKVVLMPLAAALALAACSKDQPAPVNEENNTIEELEPTEAPLNNAAPPVENLTNETPPAAPPPEVSDQEQILDDADATGLTARLPAAGEPGSAENEARPAE